jgi:hypothetical protein
MTHRPLLELVPRWAWPRQCGAEVSIENIVGMDDGLIQLENVRVLYLNHFQITTSNPMTHSSFITSQCSALFPSDADHSIPIGRPLEPRFSPIRF